MSALSGVKVLDLSRVLAGPWCGQALADLGADVIKVESFDGDDTRGMGPPYLGEISAYFACANRNKRSLCLDLHRPESAEVIRALVKDADVLIENFRTGTAERLGVGLRSPARGQSAADLLFHLRLRPHRSGRDPRRLRLRGAGRGRADGDHRRTRRRAQ